MTDAWESTPHSGGYYHVTGSYWANGALNTLGGLGLPTFTYGVDGEGRPNAVTASSGTNPVPTSPGASYNVSSQVTGLTLGSGDSDAFTFDANTGRMTQYKYTVGATPQNVIGNLTWNANGTLGTLAITDPFNSANQQTCSYSYDDLARLSGANCGSAWAQTFSFDPFGNLSKTGSVSFQPTYNTGTNRVSTVGGQSFSYDANGNTLYDTLRSYTWDAEGKSITIGSVSATYDALGRMVEQYNGTAYTDIVYSPTGGKLALMSAQTVSKAFVPLPAGAVAVYSGTTLSYFRHPDWLGSSRLASTPAQTVYSDLAYAPFGETYAESGTPDRSFTAQNQDTVASSTAGLYDFMYRQYAQYGRWVSPDPAGVSTANPMNPQSWNRFAYALNNPLSFRDLLGLEVCEYLDDSGEFVESTDYNSTADECGANGGRLGGWPRLSVGTTRQVGAPLFGRAGFARQRVGRQSSRRRTQSAWTFVLPTLCGLFCLAPLGLRAGSSGPQRVGHPPF